MKIVYQYEIGDRVILPNVAANRQDLIGKMGTVTGIAGAPVLSVRVDGDTNCILVRENAYEFVEEVPIRKMALDAVKKIYS